MCVCVVLAGLAVGMKVRPLSYNFSCADVWKKVEQPLGILELWGGGWMEVD